MTIKKAIGRLKEARKEQAHLTKEIKILREFVLQRGGNPDSRPDNTDRNAKIYKEWLTGKTFIEVAAKFGLSATRISVICNRIHRKS